MTDQPKEEKMPAPVVENIPAPAQEKKPALTVVIQSWWTPALAVVALVAGLLLGYFGRPMLNKAAPSGGDIAAVNPPVATSPVDLSAAPPDAVDPTVAAIQTKEQLMAYLVSNTTHFKGDPNATVTIIEFSDYQ